MAGKRETAKALLWEARWCVDDLLDLVDAVVDDKEGLSKGSREVIANARTFLTKLEKRKGLTP